MKRLCLTVLLSAVCSLGATTIHLFHSTDVHGYVFPYRDRQTGEKLGSFASMVPILEKARKKGEPVIFMDAGDSFQGTLEDMETKGKIITEIMNDKGLSYDLRTVGNHDFDYNRDVLENRAKMTKFPIICSNLKEESTGKLPDFLDNYKIIKKGGYKIGVFGLISSHTPKYVFPSNIKGLKFEDELPYIKSMAKKLRVEEGADFVVLISHIGFFRHDSENPSIYKEVRPELMKELLAADDNDPLNNINVVIDGHTHDVLFRKFEEDPSTVQDDTYFAQSGQYGETLGELKLNIDDKTRTITSAEFVPHRLDVKNYPPSKEFLKRYRQQQLASWRINREEIAKVKFGFFLPHKLDSKFQRDLSSLTVAKSFYKWGWSEGLRPDLAIVNTHGVRYHIFSTAGKITMETIHKVCPFENKIVTFKLSGADLIQVFKEKGKELTFYGGKIAVTKESYNNSLEPTLDIERFQIRNHKGVLEPIDPAKEYIIISPSFLAQSREFAISELKESLYTQEYAIDKTALIWLLQEESRVALRGGTLLDEKQFKEITDETLELVK
jgi:2',3'-cyclic-nucleotide 2'-phosphodiesterase (5'-nucleotidase family)